MLAAEALRIAEGPLALRRPAGIGVHGEAVDHLGRSHLQARRAHRVAVAVGQVGEGDDGVVHAGRQAGGRGADGDGDLGAAARRQRARAAADDQPRGGFGHLEGERRVAVVLQRVDLAGGGERAADRALRDESARRQDAQAGSAGVVEVERQGGEAEGVEPVAEAVVVRPAAGPAHREAAVPVREVVAAGGVAAVQLADDAVVLVEERRAAAAGLGGAEVPVVDADVRAVAGHRVAEVAGDRGRLVLEADALLVGAGVVDGDGLQRVGAAAVPAGVGHVRGRVRHLLEFDEAEVAGRVRGAEDGAGLEIRERAAAVLAAGRALEVPVDHHGGGVARADAAVVGGQEVGRAVLRRVVDQRSRSTSRCRSRCRRRSRRSRRARRPLRGRPRRCCRRRPCREPRRRSGSRR